MQPDSSMLGIVHVIQAAVAPVFLLTGVGAILSVLTGRLGRVIDRARVLEAKLRELGDSKSRAIHIELEALKRRMKLIDLSITLCTLCALFICTVIASLFVGSFWHLDVSAVVVFLFIAAMVALIAALGCFLREIFTATASVRFGLH